ncbi:MAG: hypothetical protein V7746_02055 [Halioglobus sp.]
MLRSQRYLQAVIVALAALLLPALVVADNTLTEELVGVCGTNTGLDDMPDSAPGVLQPPPVPRVPELGLSEYAYS